jgi:hypothetical protein
MPFVLEAASFQHPEAAVSFGNQPVEKYGEPQLQQCGPG